MARIYNRDNNVYSLDMMHAYIRTFKSTLIEVDLDKMKPSMKLPYLMTRDSEGKVVRISPNDVLDDPAKYPKHKHQIDNENTDMPIMIEEDCHLIEGAHRVIKACLEGKKSIRAFMFDNDLMLKFRVNTEGQVK